MKIALSYMGGNHTPLNYFARQLGIRYCVSSTFFTPNIYPGAKAWDYMILRETKRRCNDFGMEFSVYEGVEFIDAAKLGTEGRDDAIAAFCTLLENLGHLGVDAVCYNWMPVWGWYRTRVHEEGRGGALVTGFHMDDVRDAPLSQAGTLSADQLWTNLEYFLKKVVPVAEKAKVKLAVHPDDPPVPELAGIQRILITPDAMMEVCKLVPSEYNGITLCQGTFSAMGADVPAEIRPFGKAGKLFFSHFRDVKGSPENFVECFHDEGQTDMVEAVKAYYDVGFEGVSRPDHVPTMYGDDNSSPSYGINGNLFALGYMKGIIETVEKERGIFQK